MPKTSNLAMPSSLYAKLALMLALLLVAVGIMYALLTVSATQQYLQEVNQRFNWDLARDLVADRNLVQQGTLNEVAIKKTFHEYMTINPSIEIYLLDLEGTILAYSADPGKVKRRHVSLGPIHRFLHDKSPLPVLGDDPRSHDRHKAFSVTPVPSPENSEGYLYVILRGERYDSIDQTIRDSYFLQLSGWAAIVSLSFGLLLGLALFRFLTIRLRRLASAMDNFRAQGFSAPVQAQNPGIHRFPDEIDRLGATFHQMATRIVAQFEELNHKDVMRRDLVAQVSHDLRTPLASLHGYLETLQLMDSRLSAEEHSEYLNIALRHSERLARLINDLFELAKLDAQDIAPHIEPFAAGELVQDVSQKLQLRAEQRNVHLAIDLSENVPFVAADIGLIERVLENLLENALLHTPAGGTVRVGVRATEKTVAIFVADTGSGIDKRDLPRIFERFYRACRHQERGEPHAGLGLAIAKRILELHGGSIEVDSQIGRGTTFQFFLPVWNEQRLSASERPTFPRAVETENP